MGIREDSHAKAWLRRAPIIDTIIEQTYFGVKLRAGSQAIHYDKENKHNLATRMVREGHFIDKIGLDVIITAPDKQERWASIFPWYPSDRKQLPRGHYLRTKNAESGTPKEKDVRFFFGKQWAIIAYFNKSYDIFPVKLATFPFRWFLDRGLFDCEEKAFLKGFCFPNHRGRRNTVHWFTHCWAYKVVWGFTETYSGIQVTTSSVQTTISTMFQ